MGYYTLWDVESMELDLHFPIRLKRTVLSQAEEHMYLMYQKIAYVF